VVRTFNLRDGLVCVNADQPAGRQCHDYQTRYLCPNGQFSAWYNTDSPSFDGDHEERSRDQNLCASPVAIQAAVTVSGVQRIVNGPNDRLAEFDTQGLRCTNSAQGTGQSCSNYVVRFICP
jgi:hypothetical protein